MSIEIEKRRLRIIPDDATCPLIPRVGDNFETALSSSASSTLDAKIPVRESRSSNEWKGRFKPATSRFGVVT
jgi:hypothetical protein